MHNTIAFLDGRLDVIQTGPYSEDGVFGRQTGIMLQNQVLPD